MDSNLSSRHITPARGLLSANWSSPGIRPHGTLGYLSPAEFETTHPGDARKVA
jgi:hypothetical protein